VADKDNRLALTGHLVHGIEIYFPHPFEVLPGQLFLNGAEK
jgi:hypothetical protein